MGDFISGLIAWLSSFTQSASGILDFIQGIDPALRVLVTGVGALLEMFVMTGLFVPGDTVVVFAAAAISSPGEGILLGLSITIGALLGEVASYGLGYWIGSSARGARLRRGAGEARIASARHYLLKRGGPAILAARFVPVLRTVMPFVVGLNAFPFKRFLAWSVPASIAWSAIYVTIYSLAAAPLREGSGSLPLTVGLAMMGFIVFAGAYLLQVLIERRHSRGGSVRVDTIPASPDIVEGP